MRCMRSLVVALLAACLAMPAAAQMNDGPVASRGQAAAEDRLLAALKAAPDAEAATALEARLQQLWLNAGTPAVGLLMSRALHEAAGGDDKDALEDFDAALDLDPQLAEAWHQKALVHAHMGENRAAIADIAQALRLEPRHFAALETLSRIAEAQGNWKGAYDAWQRVMQLDPKTPGGVDRLNELRRRAFGEET